MNHTDEFDRESGDRTGHPAGTDAQPPAADASEERRPTRRRLIVASICIGALLLVGGAAAVATTAAQANAAPEKPHSSIKTGTTKIQKGTLSGATQVTGTLDYANQRKIGGGTGGTVTATPAPGATVGLGGGLFSVDNVPVLLLHGNLPAWRAFGLGMEDGPDVLQLEQSLAALGYFDREPDDEFAESTERAIKKWQKALGLEQTGRLELGSVVFMAGDVRVASVDSAVGTAVGPGANVISVTSLDKRIDVDLKLSDQRLGVVGAKVDVRLPGGATTTGTVTEVGVPTEKESNGQKSVTIPVTIALDDPAAAADLQRATVTVGFPTEKRENVLFVPVEALLALDSKTFGIELAGKGKNGAGKKVPVTTGLFADGMVEISGDGIAEGDDVVVPGS
ncbi:peptidoglycan-binding protein [Plantibacter sp. Mn2098]|uniref:peptidoglycan-binding protein n=1 Tax=Plantibacter sp. Mn2098 TaxID=3395266 RepID=UPI003BC35804